jgi:hypothetical protein
MLTAQPYTPAWRATGFAVLNYVSHFSDASGLLQARLAALRKVSTPAFCFVDDADHVTFKAGLPAVPQGLLYGTESVVSAASGATHYLPCKPWSLNAHLGCPTLVHRAVCNTQAAHVVAQYLPQGDYHVEWLLYFFIAAWRGAQPSEDFLYTWHKKAIGMHTRMLRASMNTSLWLLQNHRRVLQALQAHPLPPAP